MDLKWKERLVGPVVSLPTFNDDKYNLLLDRQRIHVRWLPRWAGAMRPLP